MIDNVDSKHSYIVNLLWYALIFLCITILSPVFPGVYFSHIVSFAAIIIFTFVAIKNHGGHTLAVALKCFLFCVIFTLSAMLNGVGERFYEESIKIILIIFGSYLLSRCCSYQTIKRYVTVMPCFFIIAVLLAYYRTDYHDLFSYGSRIRIEEFGSPNTLGLIATLNLIVAHTCISNKYLKYTVIPLLVSLLVITFSRSALICYFVGLYFVYGVKSLRFVIPCLLIAVILVFVFLDTIAIYIPFLAKYSLLERYNILMDISETGGTGRFQIWTELLKFWLLHPMAWFAGFGPGSIKLSLELSGDYIVSAHSMVVSVIYYFGIIGFLLLVTYLARLTIKLNRFSKDCREKHAILGVLIVSGIFDATMLASQATFYMIVFLALVITKQQCPNVKRIVYNNAGTL